MKLHQLHEHAQQSNSKALFVVGPPGSGKSTYRRVITIPGAVFIDYDHISHKIASWKGYSETDEKQMKEINPLVKKFIEDEFVDAINHLDPIILDTVGDNERLMARRIDMLKRFGYDVAAVIIDVDVDTSLERARKREQVEKRKVPEDYIRSVHSNKAFSYGRIQQYIPNNIVINNSLEGDISDNMSKINNFVNDFINKPHHSPMEQKLHAEGVSTIAPGLISYYDLHRILSKSWYINK